MQQNGNAQDGPFYEATLQSKRRTLLLILVFILLLSPPPSRPLLPRVSIPPSLLLVCLSPKCQVLHDRFLNAPERKIEGQPLELYHQSGNLRDFLVGAVFAFC